MAIRIMSVTRHLLGIAWLLISVALLGLMAVTQLAGHLDRSVYIVRGASMVPAIPLGALIAVQPVPAQDLRVGDVVTVRGSGGEVVTHRVVELDASGEAVALRTKGDASASVDVPLRDPASIIGRVDVHFPYLGYLLAFMGMPSGMVATLAALATLMLVRWALEDAIKGRRHSRQPVPALEAAVGARS
jgi:signal peptidase I